MADENGEKHVHGSMDTTEQQKMFDSFVSWVGRGIAICIVLLILLYLING
ncbi:MAG: aa3-type cytochrome c oxidase subunit IV [Pseudomonadota bacterium]